jgi:hypothetical protein
MQEEKLSFVVTLSGTVWERRPQFSIWIDDHIVVARRTVGSTPQEIKFEHTIDEGLHSIKIRLENKNNSDTVLENGSIVRDMLLNIDDITIDNISLGNLLWSAEYVLDHPQWYQGQTITKLNNCVNLGWNGTYTLKFTSPFYIWLLEQL